MSLVERMPVFEVSDMLGLKQSTQARRPFRILQFQVEQMFFQDSESQKR